MWEAILLGIVQGLTEFLPVSSSGHLVVLQHVLGFHEPLMAFDIMVHLGTLAAVLIYYRKQLAYMVTGLFGDERSHVLRLYSLVIVGTLPAVVIGLAFKDAIEHALGDPFFVACAWMLFGIVAIISVRWSNGNRRYEDMSFFDALLIGCAQSVAILPGISRSGSTIITGMSRGISPSAAANFSFLLAIPAIGGAGILQLKDTPLSGILQDPPMIAGALVSFIVGYAAIAWLLRLLARGVIRPFGIYCVVVSAITFVALLA